MGLAAAMAWILFAAIAFLTGVNFALSKRWVKGSST
jgi:ABC-type sugar transport system permease subunit